MIIELEFFSIFIIHLEYKGGSQFKRLAIKAGCEVITVLTNKWNRWTEFGADWAGCRYKIFETVFFLLNTSSSSTIFNTCFLKWHVLKCYILTSMKSFDTEGIYIGQIYCRLMHYFSHCWYMVFLPYGFCFCL